MVFPHLGFFSLSLFISKFETKNGVLCVSLSNTLLAFVHFISSMHKQTQENCRVYIYIYILFYLGLKSSMPLKV